MIEKLDVLVVAPHPDDAELGMGGAIAKMILKGQAVGVLDLTSGEPTPHGSLEIRAAETLAASNAMGLRWRENLGLPNRRLESTLEAKARLAEVFRRTQPNWIFAPYWVDAHPDHIAATELVDAARFWAKLTKTGMSGLPYHPKRIFNYFCIHLKMNPQPAFIVDISSTWPQKLEAIKCFQSQFIIGRDSPNIIEQIEIEARYWGKSIGVAFGEPFASREPVGLQDFNSLI